MRHDYQILLKSPSLNLLAGPPLCVAKFFHYSTSIGKAERAVFCFIYKSVSYLAGQVSVVVATYDSIVVEC